MFARIIENRAVDVSPDPQNHFHPDISAEFVSVPDEVQVGWLKNPKTGKWSAPPEVPVAEFKTWRLTRLAYMKRFTIREEAAIRSANDPVVSVILARLDAATYVDLLDASVKEGLDYLVSKELLTQERADIIRLTSAQPEEIA